MGDAQTSEDVSTKRLKVAETHVSRLGGGAGWWKSPCPDLAGARGEQSPRATRHPDPEYRDTP
jgi:hypothetical protein